MWDLIILFQVFIVKYIVWVQKYTVYSDLEPEEVNFSRVL